MNRCKNCGYDKKFHPMALADGLGHVERCEFVKRKNNVSRENNGGKK